MEEHRRKDDFDIEPQTADEYLKAIYQKQRDNVLPDIKLIKDAVFGNGKKGLVDRVLIIETIIYAGKWVVGIGLPALATYLIFFKH